MSQMTSPMQGDRPQSPLPEALNTLIDRVIRRTRLWNSEKRDVRAELESHFRDGLDELADDGVPLEKSVEILKESFGNPDLAATLIRRGKKRGRSMLWKFTVSTFAFIIGLIGMGAAYVAYVSSGTPSPSVDYVQQINAPIEQTPIEDRAWPILREALLAYQPPAGDLDAADALKVHPGDAEWAKVTEWLDANRHLLPQLRDASEKPAYGFVYDNTDAHAFMRELAAARGKPDPYTAVIRRSPGRWSQS